MAELIDLSCARDLVRQRLIRNGIQRRSLMQSLGCVLAESVAGDLDAPPYDKSLMDGYAVATASAADPTTTAPVRLRVVDEIMAGQLPRRTLTAGQAARIMTGAPLPSGSDAIVMLEQARRDGEWVEVPGDAIVAGRHIMRRGATYQAGCPVVEAGRRIRPLEIGLLAEAGCVDVPVVRPATVAVIATGDELVPAGQRPTAGQIRNSNGPMLEALVRRCGGEPTNLGIVRDSAEQLDEAVRAGLNHDVLILSGGVSAGDRDLVPDALLRAGVTRVFHKVKLRPGKPLWFGVGGDQHASTCVFGLPGNPISGLVCFEIFVAPALATISGEEHDWHEGRAVTELAEPFTLNGARPTYWPGRLNRHQASVRALPWLGSADPFSLAIADCLIFFPEGDCTYDAGTMVKTAPLS